MTIKSLLRRLSHLPLHIVRSSLMVTQVLQFFLLNRVGRKLVIEPEGPIVSLTTHGKRSNTVYLAIESIARGERRPSHFMLWIDNKALINNLPPSIRRLQRRGLEVRQCQNYGPHTKYYPFIESQDCFEIPLATADDDILYPRYWLKKLAEANRDYTDTVNCYLSHVIPVNQNGFEKYCKWAKCNSTNPSFRHLAAGVMGVIYPPSFLTVLKRAGTAFEACCPKGDDLWLHLQALRAGYKVRQVFPSLPYFAFQEIPGTQQTALCHGNVDSGDGNERQMKATYGEADFQLLCNEVAGTAD
jgi:hypothetical protein